MAPLKPTDIQRPSAGRDPGVRASPLRVDDSKARALGNLAQATAQKGRATAEIGYAAADAVGTVARAFQALHERRQASEDAVSNDRFDLELTKAYSPKIIEAVNNPSDDPEFISSFDETLVTEGQNVLTRMKAEGHSFSEDGLANAERIMLNHRTSAARQVAMGVNNARVARLQSAAQENYDAISRSQAPLEEKLARVDASVDAVIETVDPAKRQGYRQAALTTVYKMHVTGLEVEAQRAIEKGDYATAKALMDEAEAVTGKLIGFAPATQPETIPGMVINGNIDLMDRTPVTVEGGTATLRSMSVNVEGREVLIPTVHDGKELTPEQAVNRYRVTGEHLGIFDTPDNATAYGKKLSADQGAMIDGKSPRGVAGAIVGYAKKHGADPLVGLAIAHVESALNPSARNPKSTAGGLFQFITETGRAYGLPPDASRASVAQQAEAGAKLIADNVKKLEREIGSQPTPGEVYLAHFLGVDRALNVIGVDPDMPLGTLLSASVFEANPVLKGMTAGDMRAWAQAKMQGAIEYVTAAGFIEGRKVDVTTAGIPLDEAVRLNEGVWRVRDAIGKAEEADRKEFQSFFDLSKPRSDRDPAGYVAKKSDRVGAAFINAQAADADEEADFETKAGTWREAIDTTLEEQEALGITGAQAKALPTDAAKAMVHNFAESKGPEATAKFYKLKEQSGEHWDKVFGELVEQKLPPAYQILSFLEPARDATLVNAVGQVLNLSEADLKANLGDAESTVKQDVLDQVEVELEDFLQALELGYGNSAKQMGNGFSVAIKNVALLHYRAHRDAGAAVEFATGAINNAFEVVETSNVQAIVPREFPVSSAEIEDAADAKQLKSEIEAFNPVVFSYPDKDPEMDKSRTISAAANSGIWVTNETGDGLALIVPVGGGVTYQPLVNVKGERYEIKFSDMGKIAKEHRIAMESVAVPPGYGDF